MYVHMYIIQYFLTVYIAIVEKNVEFVKKNILFLIISNLKQPIKQVIDESYLFENVNYSRSDSTSIK